MLHERQCLWLYRVCKENEVQWWVSGAREDFERNIIVKVFHHKHQNTLLSWTRLLLQKQDYNTDLLRKNNLKRKKKNRQMLWKKNINNWMKNWKLHYTKGQFILSQQKQRQGPRFKISSKKYHQKLTGLLTLSTRLYQAADCSSMPI